MELCQYPCACRPREFSIEAIQIPIVYNKYGDYDPDGLLYVRKEDSGRIREEALRRFHLSPPQPYEEVHPMVLRVNRGDRVKVRFYNSLNRRLSIHVQGMTYDVHTSDGTSVGYNQDSTKEHEILYTWYADTEGVFLFHDMADSGSSEDATNIPCFSMMSWRYWIKTETSPWITEHICPHLLRPSAIAQSLCATGCL